MISQKTRSSLTIFIGSLLIVVGTIVLVAMASGYNINLFSWEISSFGLVKLNSNPNGASIKINGKPLRQKTPYQLENVRASDIKVEYAKEGYQGWSAEYAVKPGLVTFADYALLIPTSIETKTVESDLKTSSLVNSNDHDRSFVLSQEPAGIHEIQRNYQLRKIGDLPINASLKQATSLSDPIINDDGSAIIVKASYPDSRPVTLWLNTANGIFVNVEDLFAANPSQLIINPKNSKEIYGLIAGQVTRTNAESRITLKLNPVNVASLWVDADYLFTVENKVAPEKGQSLVRYDHNGNNRIVLKDLNDSVAGTNWKIDSSKLGGVEYVTILNPTDGKLILVKSEGDKVVFSDLGSKCASPVFNGNGRFLSFSQNDSFRTLDLEYTERFVTSNPSIALMQWFTEYQLLIYKSEGLYIVDYNGFNSYKLPSSIAVNSSQTSFFNSNKTIFFITENKLRYYALQPKGQFLNF